MCCMILCVCRRACTLIIGPLPGCDWVQFQSDSGSNLTSQLSGTQFPGAGMPELVVPAGSCRMKFHTDGTRVYWGWRFTATFTVADASAPLVRPACDGPFSFN